VALECERPASAPARRVLHALTEVEIGRGGERAAVREGARLRLEVPDRAASQVHARLARAGTSWTIEDAGSKNGTIVNGARIAGRAALDDGDVIECGGTFFVLRRAWRRTADLDGPSAPIAGMGTVSPSLERELETVARMAAMRMPVLLRGETGTGKEVVAKAIHHASRRPGALVAVNCGALPATLVESELLGSRRGAFSGAEDRKGMVQRAHLGTLFLDEIAELPAPSQAALLRVLQDGVVLPLGATTPVEVDVRLVAATNQPLEQWLSAGRFRRDLYARLRGYEVRLPTLRARIEDLGLLTGAILAKLGAADRRLTRGAARALFRHRWPLNVRELEQVLHAAVGAAAGDLIAEGNLAFAPAPAPPDASGEHPDRRELVVSLLERRRGNLAAVARDLGTSRAQVTRLLGRYGIDAESYRR
jgi:transcriptional regulator with PAS, ATPase and Fis domain